MVFLVLNAIIVLQMDPLGRILTRGNSLNCGLLAGFLFVLIFRLFFGADTL